MEEIYYAAISRGIPGEVIIYLLNKSSGNELPLPSSLKSKLLIEGYLTESMELTDKAYDVLACIHTKVKAKRFKAFWDSYPVTDKHGFFPKTRFLRGDKDQAIKWYELSLLNIEEDELIRALQRFVFDLTEDKTRNNLATAPPLWKFLMNRIYERYRDQAYQGRHSDQEFEGYESEEASYFVRPQTESTSWGVEVGQNSHDSGDELQWEVYTLGTNQEDYTGE